MVELLPNSKNCFYCSKDNPEGMKLDYYIQDGEKVFTKFIGDKKYGVSEYTLNPGIVFGVLVEAMGWLVAYKLKNPAAFLVDYNARVLKPMPIGRMLTVEVESVLVGKWLSQVKGHVRDDEGDVYAKTAGKFMIGNSQDEKVGDHRLPSWK